MTGSEVKQNLDFFKNHDGESSFMTQKAVATLASGIQAVFLAYDANLVWIY
tara:strand:- start:1033 stop:1185 length:153 start_codon:yes stop_codon:yes gene_type:complete